MNQYLIYWPVLAQVLITFLVLMLNGKRKREDIRTGKYDREKSAMNNEAWSVPVILTSKNLANQTQLPVIFYVLCLMTASIGAVDLLYLSLAWAFVATRYVHAYVHVTTNYIPVRLRAFMLGTIILIVLFVLTVLSLANSEYAIL